MHEYIRKQKKSKKIKIIHYLNSVSNSRHLVLPLQPFVTGNVSTQIIPASASCSSCPEFGMWIIPPVQCCSRARAGEKRGEIGIPQVLNCCHIFPDEIENVSLLSVGSEYIGILSLQSTQLKMLPTNRRDTSVLQIFNNPQRPTNKKEIRTTV